MRESEFALEILDLGDAMVETKQMAPPFMIQDNCCMWGYFGVINDDSNS